MSLRLKTGMPLRTASAAIALVAFAPALEPVQSPELDATTIVHVTVVDVSTGKELPDETAVLEGDHIVSVAGAQTAGCCRYTQAGHNQEVRHNSSRPYSPGRERFSCFFSLKTKNLKPSGRKA